jgi:hypothetical protein
MVCVGQEQRSYLCVFCYILLWLAAVDGRLERDETGAVQAQTTEAFEKLRLGFALSIVSVVLSALSAFELTFLFVLVPAAYFLGIYERASGWRLLGFGQTETVMWLSAFLLVVSPLGLVLIGLLGLSYSNINMDAVSLIPPALWIFYTAVESHNAGKLEKKLGLNLRHGRIFAFCGILTLAAVYGLAFFSGIFSPVFYILPFTSVVFASPFLILSCVTFIIKLKPK